ncbi:MAG: ribosome maturation factor RimP [Hydrogenothermaceae bacterium]|nr:ribosome maturation factor RimP [Hydrogenothermaceae bacterium]
MKVTDRVKELLEPILEERGLKLVDIELTSGKRPVLRIYIYNPEGTSIDDCEWVSKRIGSLLDVEDLIPTSYTLEVSSPGLDRKIKNPHEYEIFKGRDIKIKTSEMIDERNIFKGVLRGIEDNKVCVDEDGKIILIPIDKISSAKLEF